MAEYTRRKRAQSRKRREFRSQFLVFGPRLTTRRLLRLFLPTPTFLQCDRQKHCNIMQGEMGRSMWVEAPVAAAGALMGCHLVFKVVWPSSSRVPASNLTGTAGGGIGSGLDPELADVLTDVNFLGNLFALFTVSFVSFLWVLRPPMRQRSSGRSGFAVRRDRASPEALSRASTAPATCTPAIEDELFSLEDQLFSSEISDDSSNIPVSNDSDLKHWDDVCVCVCRPDGLCRSGQAVRAGTVHVLSGHSSPAGQPMTIMPRSLSAKSVRHDFGYDFDHEQVGGHTNPAVPGVHEPSRPRRPGDSKESCLSAPALIEGGSTRGRSVSVCSCEGGASCVSAGVLSALVCRNKDSRP